jgi:MFS family permease
MGIFTAAFAMLMSSFCKSVPPLIGTQGVLFGMGGCFAFCTCAMYIDEWFSRRKGMAYGIMWSAAGLGGVILPLILQALLDNLGFQTATRIWAAILFASAAPFTFFIKPRLPYSAVKHKKKLNLRFTMSKIFITHQVANFIQATGYFLPGIYLPTYAREIFGTSTIMSTLTVILLNIASATSCIIMGIMTDKLPVITCLVIAAAGAAISVLLFWGLAVSLPMLYVFCVLYGLFPGSWTAIWPGMMKEISQRGEDEGYGFVDPLLVYSFLCIGRGVGNLISGPLSEAFLRGMPWQGEVIGGFGSGYGVLIVYTGVTGLAGGLNFIWKCLHWL